MAYNVMTVEEIRIAIIKEAKAQFLEKGIRNTEMKDIAKNIGIGRSTLYRYFSHKDQLAFIVTMDILKELHTYYNFEGSEVLTGYQRLVTFCEHFIDCLEENPKIASYLMEFDCLFEGIYPDYPEVEIFLVQMEEGIIGVANLIQMGIADGSIGTKEEPKFYASVIVNTMLGLAQRVLVRKEHIEAEQKVSAVQVIKVAVRALVTPLKKNM